MTYASKTTEIEIENFAPAKKLQQILRTNIWHALLFTAGLLAGLSGAFSPAARAQETRPDISRAQKADLSRMVVVGDSLSAGFENDSLWDAQQVHGWASVLADQA